MTAFANKFLVGDEDSAIYPVDLEQTDSSGWSL